MNQSLKKPLPVWAQVIGLFLLVFLAYSPTLTYDFVTYDDPEFVTGNPMVNNGLTGANLKWALTSPGDGNLCSPLASISHQIDVSLFGLDPAGHHAASVFWHALGAVFLFLVMRRLVGSTWLAVLLTLLWAFHPGKTQTVVWISERKGVLSGAFCFASLFLYLKARKSSRLRPGIYSGSLCCFLLAGLAKPSVLPLPLVLFILLEFDPSRWLQSSIRSLRKIVPFLIVAAVVALLVIYFRSQGTLSEVGSNDSLLERARLVVMSFAFYPARFIWPFPSRLLFNDAQSEGFLWIALVVLLVFWMSVWFLRKRDPLIWKGALVYLVLWLPVSGVIPISHYFVADRYGYLPQLGFLLMVAGVCRWLAGGIWWRVPAMVFVAWIAASFVFLQMHLPIWENSETLFGHERKVNPTSGMAAVHYGEFFLESDPERALAHFREAHQKAPEEGMPLTKVGETELLLGRKEEALATFLQATRLARPVRETWTKLLVLQVELKKIEEAEATVRESVDRFPNDWAMLMNGGKFFLLVRKDPSQALSLFLEAHRLDPEQTESINACIECYRHLGDIESAEKMSRMLLE